QKLQCIMNISQFHEKIGKQQNDEKNSNSTDERVDKVLVAYQHVNVTHRLTHQYGQKHDQDNVPVDAGLHFRIDVAYVDISQKHWYDGQCFKNYFGQIKASRAVPT